jgi:AraC-like DNA-binding protein
MPMISGRFIPRSPLAAFVRCFWYSEGAPQTHSREALMPNGEPTIVITLHEDPIFVYDADHLQKYQTFRHAVLIGARSEPSVIDTKQEDCVFGIQFQPGGAFPFFHAPAAELHNQHFALEDFWKSSVSELRERLLEAPSAAAMAAFAEKFLFARLVRPLELHPAVAYARDQFCSAPHTSAMSAVLGRIGLSQRRFIQLFRSQVGLRPKEFCRVRRFQRVLGAVHGSAGVDWAQVALDCGYYDQSHFIHDFRAFSGFTPEQYLTRATEHLNHVPLA